MIAHLKPYSLMKNSGVEWFGEVPEHWEVRKLKHLTRFHNGIAFKPSDWKNSGVPIIRIQNLNGSDHFNYTTRTDLPSFLRIRNGDLLFSWSGNRGTSFGPFIWNRGFEGYLNQHIFKLDGYSLNRSYFAYLLRSVTRHIEEQSHGIIGLVHVTKPELGSVLVPVASPPEQSAIVRFLDHAVRKIGHYIRTKQKLIKLLEEQKQTIIFNAVTHGLNPNVRLKPSGVEWLGSVPEHWEVRRAKYFYREVDNRSQDGEEELLSVSHITGVTPRSQKNITMFMASSYVGHKVCQPGDLIINTMWAWMGALGVTRHTGIVSPSYGVYRPLRVSSLLSDYADILLRIKPYVSEFLCRSTGIQSSRLRLYPEQFLRVPIVCPPVNEQRAILQSLSVDIVNTEQTITSAKREVTLLSEYRTRLISDVITGKLDVREAAARLPDEMEKIEALEDEGLFENGEEAEDEDLDATLEEAEA